MKEILQVSYERGKKAALNFLWQT